MAKKTIKQTIDDIVVSTEEQMYEVPSNWCWTRIGSLVEICLGLTHTPTYVDSGVPFISVKDMSSGYLDMSDTKYITKEEYDSLPYGAKPKKGDILFARVGTIGVPQVLDIDEEIGTFVSLGFFRLHHENVLREYICHWMNSIIFDEQVAKNVKGSTLKNLNTGWLKDFQIPLPPLAEQKRIVEQIENLFSKLDEAKEKAQYVVDNYDTNRAAVLCKAFTGDLTENWRRKNNIRNTWMTKTIGEVFSVFSGKGFKEKEYSTEGVKLLRISNVTYDTLVWDDVKYLPEDYLTEVPELVLKKDDIVMALNRPITNGKLKISVVDIKEPYILYQRVGCLRQKETNNIEFLRYVLQTRDFLGQVENNLQGSDQPYINIPPLKSLEIRICDIQEQNEVVSILETMLPNLLQAKEAAENTLEQIELIKKSILAKAFRGELGTNIPDDESSLVLLMQITES